MYKLHNSAGNMLGNVRIADTVVRCVLLLADCLYWREETFDFRILTEYTLKQITDKWKYVIWFTGKATFQIIVETYDKQWKLLGKRKYFSIEI